MPAPRRDRSPRSGDRVRGVTDNRTAEPVEGVLYIRHVPTLSYAQVKVIGNTDWWSVTPESIEVVRESELTIEELERDEPLVDDPGWRRISDLAEAAEAGLLPVPRPREGGTWGEMFDGLAARASPMIDAGWRLVSTDRDESREYGDSVFYDLERDGTAVELEFYEHGQLVAYPVFASAEANDAGEVFFSLHDSSPESALEAFQTHGWV